MNLNIKQITYVFLLLQNSVLVTKNKTLKAATIIIFVLFAISVENKSAITRYGTK